MMKNTWKAFSLMAFCGTMALVNPGNARAAEISGPGIASGTYIATINVDSVDIMKDEGGQNVLFSAPKGAVFQVVEDMGDGDMKIKVRGVYGYLPVDGKATVSQTDEATVTALNTAYEAKAKKKVTEDFRSGVVNYALQFVGGRYVYGGNDPHTGVDCSGFTRYVMQHAAGIPLNHSAAAQSVQGRAIDSSQMRPGDLIFYGSGKSINHVGMYIGNGQVVHASTYKTGIKTSPWNYRAPVKIIDVIGDR